MTPRRSQHGISYYEQQGQRVLALALAYPGFEVEVSVNHPAGVRPHVLPEDAAGEADVFAQALRGRSALTTSRAIATPTAPVSLTKAGQAG